MVMTNILLLTIVAVGLSVGSVASTVFRGTGLGTRTDLLLGILGAFFGSWLLPLFGLPVDGGFAPVIASAAFGAVALLLVLRIVGVKRCLPGT